MARKSKTALEKTLEKTLQKKLRLSPRYSGLIALVILLLLGLIHPDVRNQVAETLNLPDVFTPYKPLPAKKKGQLQEGIWTVSRVVDGDTLVINGNEGKEYRVRLIGADTPETVKPNTPVEPFGLEASEFTKQKIAGAGNRVRIAFDGDQVDKYDRCLAMVYLQMPDDEEVWLNELLIREGLARAQLQYHFSKGAKDAFRRAEAEAKSAKRNLWSLPADGI